MGKVDHNKGRPKRDFNFTVVYYDRKSGHARFEGHFSHKCEYEITRARNHRPLLSYVGHHIRGLRDAGGPGSLPGLDDDQDGWDGPILVFHERCFHPYLIHAAKKE